MNVTTGHSNTAVGFQALYGGAGPFITPITYNTAIGYQALYEGANAATSVAIGAQALYHGVNSGTNVAIGYWALYSDSGGNQNVAVGTEALYSNAGYSNTAVGHAAMYYNTTGLGNVAFGLHALYNSTTGSFNTAIGDDAFLYNTSGSYNTAIGANATINWDTLTNATAIGANATVSQSNSLVLGATGTNVGIGIDTPKALLDVAGNVRIADGTQGAGYVLTSDASGFANWQPISSTGIAQSAQFVQYGAQPSPVNAGQPLTYSVTILSSSGITAATGIFGLYTQSGTVFTLADTGRYEVNYQVNNTGTGGIILYMGATTTTMAPLMYTMIGAGTVTASIIVEIDTPNSVLSVNAAAGNTGAFNVPANSSSNNQSATTVSIKQIY